MVLSKTMFSAVSSSATLRSTCVPKDKTQTFMYDFVRQSAKKTETFGRAIGQENQNHRSQTIL
jgi:hypothetical protein